MNSVSVIIICYNPNWEKLELTLKSAIKQKNIQLEIVVSDDGSSENYFNKIKVLMDHYGVDNYLLLGHDNNVGTVQNITDALDKCHGEYVYAISPGDFFYDSCTLKKLYDFCKDNACDICFGNAVYYSKINYNDRHIELTNNCFNHPYNTDAFKNSSKCCFDFLTLAENNVLGATFFRKLDKAQKYIGTFAGVSKYLEDYPSLIYAVSENEKIGYMNDYIVWYENGTGVSSGKNSKWENILETDLKNSCRVLAEKYINQKRIYDILIFLSLENKNAKILFLIKGHLVILIKKICLKIYLRFMSKVRINSKAICYDFSNELLK